jgi:RNA polymerase sigma-70 factor (ECF subfamily)
MRPVPPSLEAALPRAAPSPVHAAAGLRSDKAPVAAAERLSFDDVYDACFDFVWRNARRLGVPGAQVDDAVQEVFLVVHRRLAEFEGRSSIKTWIFGILVKVAADHRRTLRRKSPHARSNGAVVEPDTIADEEASPDARMVRSEGVRLLHQLLGELDDDKRAVFVLAELEQMSAPEIAEALGLNLNTVYARLRTARIEFDESARRERARDGWRLK